MEQAVLGVPVALGGEQDPPVGVRARLGADEVDVGFLAGLEHAPVDVLGGSSVTTQSGIGSGRAGRRARPSVDQRSPSSASGRRRATPSTGRSASRRSGRRRRSDGGARAGWNVVVVAQREVSRVERRKEVGMRKTRRDGSSHCEPAPFSTAKSDPEHMPDRASTGTGGRNAQRGLPRRHDLGDRGITPSAVRVGAYRGSVQLRPRCSHTLRSPSAAAPPMSASGLSPISQAPPSRIRGPLRGDGEDARVGLAHADLLGDDPVRHVPVQAGPPDLRLLLAGRRRW